MKRPPWSITSLFLSSVTIYPLVVGMYLKDEIKKEIEKEINKNDIDLIHAETFYVMPNIPVNHVPTILVEQTIEYLVYQHYTQTVKFIPLRGIMNFDVMKIKYWEKRFWQKATRVVAMSEADKNIMKQYMNNLTVDIVPNGVDHNFFTLKKKSTGNLQNRIIFVGNFKWLQNREAVNLLISEVWPIVKKKIPPAKLWIVGKYPPEDIKNNINKDIEISDNIEDIREAYANSDVMLAPIFGPGGTRYKILESMAMGLPVITTSTGIEGLGVQNRVHALISDTPKGLADLTVEVLTNRKLYNTLVEKSRELVVKNFNWTYITEKLDHIYKEAYEG